MECWFAAFWDGHCGIFNSDLSFVTLDCEGSAEFMFRGGSIVSIDTCGRFPPPLISSEIAMSDLK